MSSLISGFEYDIFISYRHKDNKGERWVTDFVAALKTELESTFKEEISVYFDENPHDGLLETHNVDRSLEGKLKCLIFIPIISRTYCDPKSFAWQNEFCAFNSLTADDSLGRYIKLANGNVVSRILPIKIHDLDVEDKVMLESELGSVFRSIEFIFRAAGVNRPLRANEDHPHDNHNKTFYRDQINKVAIAVKEIIGVIQRPTSTPSTSSFQTDEKRNWPKPARKNRRLAITAGIILLTILLSYLIFQSITSLKVDHPDKSIVVLPFEDLSEEHDQEYFSNGMMAEIINHLSKIGDLRVISRTSSMKYKGAMVSVSEIAKELGVSNILEGTVRKSGDRIRISVVLTDGKNNKTLWSENYDRDLKDILAVQTDVSTRVAEILKTKLTLQERGFLAKTYTDNPQAQKFYLKGRFFWDKRSRETYDSAERNFKRAIELDPGYALAYAGLADCYIIVNFKGKTQLETVPIAKAYLSKALSLDSTLGEAWTTVGFIQSMVEFDWKGSKPTFEKAIRLNPNYPIAHLFYSNVLFYWVSWERGMSEIKKALDLDPLSSTINYALGRRYYEMRDYDMAIRQLQKTLTIEPGYPAANLFLGLAYIQKKNYKQAIEVFNRLPTVAMQRGFMLSYAYSMEGEKELAQALLSKTTKEDGIDSHYLLALPYVGLGNFNEALAELEKAYEMKEIFISEIKVFPALDPLRSEPRFKALLKKVNLE